MRPGELVDGRFEVIGLVGSGGMGMVHRARDRFGGGDVAIKVLRDVGGSSRFAREARILAGLSHPAIVRHVAHGTTDAGPYLAMEWLEGEDLEQRLARAELTPAEAVEVVGRAAEALGVAHARGIVHRDLKPGNLFLVAGDVRRVKVLDFGVARHDAAATHATHTGDILGTPSFMAPEQARGRSDVDARADVFSLGCLLYRCVTGRLPFEASHPMAVLAKILLEEAPRIGDVRPRVPLALDHLVARMLSKDPLQRPRDGHAVRDALDQLGDLDAMQPARTAPPPALSRGEQRILGLVLARAVPEEQGELGPAMAAAVERYEARIEHLRDGAVVAVLTGRGELRELAIDAARCALEVAERVAGVQLVLATGRGVLGERRAFGETIERAVAHAYGAPPGPWTVSRIQLDEATAALLGEGFEIRGEGVERALVAERTPSAEMRGVPPRAAFVGRERELAALLALYDESVAEPRAQAVLVVGAPGIGKSRLLQEFVERLPDRPPAMVLRLRGEPIRTGSAFGLLAAGLRREAAIVRADPPTQQWAALRARLSRRISTGELGRVANFLGEIAGLPALVEDDALRAARRDAMLMGDQLRRAFEDFLAAECAAGPVIVVIEDVQWADLPTVQFLDGALRALVDAPLLVLASARPGFEDAFPRLFLDRGAHYLTLGPLTRRASDELLSAVTDADIDAASKVSLVARAGGNPLYLEELVRAFLAGHEQAETLIAMAQLRLERLEPDARRLLRAGSVFGEAFWRDGVRGLLGGDDSDVDVSGWLRVLVERDILTRRTESRFPGCREYAFAHAILRDAAYAMLTDEDRTLGHRLAGRWLESMGESEAAQLAEHYSRGGESVQSVRCLRRAAEQALEANDFSAVVTHAQRGVEGGAGEELRGMLRLLEAEARRWRGDAVGALECAREALAFLSVGTSAWFGAAGELALAAGRRDRRDELVAIAREVVSATPSFRDGSWVLASSRVAIQLFLHGERALGERILDSLERGAESGGLDRGAHARVALAHFYYAVCTGDVGAALAFAHAAVVGSDAIGDRRAACVQRGDLAFAQMELGAYEAAVETLRNVIETAERLGGLRTPVVSARENLGLALARLGRRDEAREILARAVDGAHQAGDARIEAGARITLSELALAEADLDSARRHAEAAIALLEPTSPARAHGLSALAAVELAAGAGAAALEWASAAHEMVLRLGIDVGEAFVRLTFAQALDAVGATVEAARAAGAACQRLQERASLIADPTLRRSFLARVPESARTLELADAWRAGG